MYDNTCQTEQSSILHAGKHWQNLAEITDGCADLACIWLTENNLLSTVAKPHPRTDYRYDHRRFQPCPEHGVEYIQLDESQVLIWNADPIPDLNVACCHCETAGRHANPAPESICHPIPRQAISCSDDAAFFYDTLYAARVTHAE